MWIWLLQSYSYLTTGVTINVSVDVYHLNRDNVDMVIAVSAIHDNRSHDEC